MARLAACPLPPPLAASTTPPVLHAQRRRTRVPEAWRAGIVHDSARMPTTTRMPPTPSSSSAPKSNSGLCHSSSLAAIGQRHPCNVANAEEPADATTLGHGVMRCLLCPTLSNYHRRTPGRVCRRVSRPPILQLPVDADIYQECICVEPKPVWPSAFSHRQIGQARIKSLFSSLG